MAETPHPISALDLAVEQAAGGQVDVSAAGLAGGGRRALTYEEALARLDEAEDTLRAIGVGEIDAFVVSDGSSEPRVYTLFTADRPYRRFVENMRDGAATLSPMGVILYANRRLADLLSCPPAELLGSELAAFMSHDVVVDWESLMGPQGHGTTIELDLFDAHGRTIPVLVGVSPMGEDDDRNTCLTFTDLSSQKAQDQEIVRLSQAQADRLSDLQAAQAALTRQATHDALTGLANRDLLVDRIDQALRQGARTGDCAAVLFIDLDRFKQINVTQGHAVGNRVLEEVADRLLATLRDMDTVARLGGDEFAVLAPVVSNHHDAMEMAARLVREVARCRGATGEVLSASIGISISDGGRGSAELMLHEAETAMYRAKSLGGARSASFDRALADEVRARASAQDTLRTALDERRVVPYYQPILNLASGAIAGFEALARLVQVDGSVLAPAAFIAVAEDSGLVLPLGTQVLEQACLQGSLWQEYSRWDNGFAVAVNVSSRQLQPGDFASVVRDILSNTGLAPQRLHLELTETAIMDLHPEILRQLSRIREYGAQIGLDDFGTGYASLTHLRRLPLDFVKVDRSFVQGLGTDAGDERIVGAVIDLVHNLGLRSIAEGVETTKQLDRLRELGCDQAQGYLFAPPAPAEELLLGGYELPSAQR